MVSPISAVSFKPTADNAMKVIEGSQKAISTLSNLKEGTDEFTKNMKQDADAYSDALTSVAEKTADNKVLAPVAKIANSKAGKTIASVLGGFTAFCTSLASAATTVSTTSTFLGK